MGIERHLAVLRRIVQTLDGIDWALTGSLGLALQGVEVSPGDIDIQTNEAEAYLISQRLPGEVIRPVAVWESPVARTHFGQRRIDGLLIDVIGGWQIRSTDGGYGHPIDIRAIRRWVPVAELNVPVIDLLHEAAAYERLGRHDRSALIRQRIADSEPRP